MNNQVRVSVILPVYGVEKYIKQTIQSVLDQTDQYFEIIVVDDESPDQSVDICQSFSDPRITIVHQKNRGLAGARNTGIRHARGEYLAFLDGDDLWHPQKLEKHVCHLQNSPNVGVSYSSSAFIDDDNNPLGIYQMPKLLNISIGHIICRNPIGNGSAPVIRREVLDAIAFQENRYGQVETFFFDDGFRSCEDLECWFRIATQTDWAFEGLPDVLTLYRINPGGLSANLANHLSHWERVIEKTRSYAPEIIGQWENRARAYLLRYLARRAVTLRDGALALAYFKRAIAEHWQMIFEEPKRTVITGTATVLLCAFPRPFYQWLESTGLRVIRQVQGRRLVQHQAPFQT
ncbi:MAG: glycosyltransferase family 2 protein, partial [Merismopedia sp. SIO2A8]|nr:glycosyltransferase family 2 protein [Merismopedia sp. SIO2A8]